MPDADDTAANFLAYQLLSRIYNALDNRTFYLLLLGIAQRSDDLEKLQRYQAVAILADRMLATAVENHYPRAAHWLALWQRTAYDGAATLAQRLFGSATFPPTDEGGVILDFINDAVLMDVLGLEPGVPADIKTIDPELDF